MSELIPREPSAPLSNYAPRSQDIYIDDYIDAKQGELGRYAGILLKRKWWIVAVAAIVFAASAGWTSRMTPIYKSTVNLQIDAQQNVLPYLDAYASVTGDPRYLGTQAQVLKSEALAKRIVTRLKLTSDVNGVPRVARWFSGQVTVTPVDGTQVLKVSVESPDPAFAALAVNTLADEYVDYGFEAKRESTTKAREFLQAELVKLKEKLEESEQRLVTYGRAHGILLPSEDKNVIMERLLDLNREMTKVQAEVLANQYALLRNATPEIFPERLKTGVMMGMENRRADLQQRLATATAQFGPKWPEVARLTQDLDQVERQLSAEKQKVIEAAKVEYQLATAHRDRLAGALEIQNGLADQLTQDSIEYNILKREVETDRELHEGLLQRLKETDVSAGLKAANVHVIDRGHVPTVPSSPNVRFNLLLGLTFGLLMGGAAALVVEFFDRSIKVAEDVERELGIPALGIIASFERKAATAGQLAPLSVAARPGGIGGLAARWDSYPCWESYRSLRTALLFSSPERRPQTDLVTSALPQEGKTTTTINLAIALAQTGARTLILELDMRRPTLSSTFQMTPDRGMSLYLSGQAKLNTEIQQTGIPNLFAIPAGPRPPNPPELVGSVRMKMALELLQKHFDYVLIDGPPLVPITDASIIASQVDGVILVVGGRTAVATVQKARNLLQSVDATILGAVINNVKTPAPKDYYAAAYSS